MDSFMGLLKIVVICGALVFALFIILLAMPKSRLRSIVLEMAGWFVTGASATLVISPVDLVPDFIPVLGQMDDLGYIVIGVTSAVLTYLARRQRQRDHLLA